MTYGIYTVRLGRPQAMGQLIERANEQINDEETRLGVRLAWKLVRLPYFRDGHVCLDYEYHRVKRH